jgi:hypothetical protein
LMSISCKTITISVPDRSLAIHQICNKVELQTKKINVSMGWFSSLSMLHVTWWLQALVLLMSIQHNSFNPAPMGPDRYQIIKYSRLSSSSYTGLSSYR